MENSGNILSESQHDLVYKLNDNPPFIEKVFAAFQHISAILIPIMVPGYIVASSIGCDSKTTTGIICMCLIISGFGTFLQAKRIGIIGSGLLSIQGTSFGFVGILIVTGKIGGIPLILGTCMIGCLIQFIVAFFLRKIRKIFPPIVSGTVVSLIGATLIHVGVDTIAGGASARAAGTYASPKFIIIAGVVVLLIILFQSAKVRILRTGCILFAILAGTLLSIPFGMVDLSALQNMQIISITKPFQYGVSFSFATLIPMLIIFFITAIEAVGDITATALLSGEPIKGNIHMQRMSGGIVTDGLSSFLGSIFGGFPLSCFAQNNGIIQITGVASRHIGYYVAGFLVLAGLFPVITNLFQVIPQPVLGGGMLIMFGTIMAAGIKILSLEKLNRKALIIISVSIACGMTAETPDILQNFPDIIKYSFSSGIGTGGLAAIILNLLLPEDKEKLKAHSAQES